MILDADTQAYFDLVDRLDDYTPAADLERRPQAARKYAATLERGLSSAFPARKSGDAPTAAKATAPPGRRAVGSAALRGGGRADLLGVGR